MLIPSCLNKLLVVLAIALSTGIAFGQNPLFIPDTLNGTVFNLNVQTGTQQIIGTYDTPTYGYNGDILGPTLIMNQGDVVTLNVTNKLKQSTTVHWH